MTRVDNRKHPRINSLHLLNYRCKDADGSVIHQGMGRTLNVSESGILLETHAALGPTQGLSLTIGIEDETVDIEGRLVYAHQTETGTFQCGIDFFDIDPAARMILKQYIAAFGN